MIVGEMTVDEMIASRTKTIPLVIMKDIHVIEEGTLVQCYHVPIIAIAHNIAKNV